MGKSRYLVVLVAMGAIIFIYNLNPGVIRFKGFSAAEFTQQLTPLVLIALFIERSLEVFLNVWRGGQETKLQRTVDKASQCAKVDPTKLSVLHDAEDALADYRHATQQIAIPAALTLGILISALGIRGLGTLLDRVEFGKLPGPQQIWFTIADVLMTGALLGGGSDFVHQVITTFTDLMDATSQKAVGPFVPAQGATQAVPGPQGAGPGPPRAPPAPPAQGATQAPAAPAPGAPGPGEVDPGQKAP
jgi:hypothetical protein